MQYYLILLKNSAIFYACLGITAAVTMQQFDQSLDMMRNGCAPKFKVPEDLLDKLRQGEFTEGNADLKVVACYVRCIAQLAGTVTKKGELNVAKAIAQIPIILPVELQDKARAALESCKDTQKNYKESCDKFFYVTKCVRDVDPESFKFP